MKKSRKTEMCTFDRVKFYYTILSTGIAKVSKLYKMQILLPQVHRKALIRIFSIYSTHLLKTLK